MFRTILVPLDGSPLAARALPYAALLADPGTTLVLVGVVEPVHDLFFLSAEEQAEEEGRLRTLLRREIDAVAQSLYAQGFVIIKEIRTGDAAEEILACATGRDADLIVMTAHGDSGFTRWMLGSVANRLLHATAIPTLVLHPDMAPDQHPIQPHIETIVVPLDGSRAAEEVLPFTQALAKRLSVPVQLVHVVDGSHLAIPSPETQLAALEEWEQALEARQAGADQYIRGLTRRLTDDGLTATGIVMVGDPAAKIADFVDGRPATLVVMADRGHAHRAGWTLGSVTEKAISAIHCPLLVIRSEDAHEGAQPGRSSEDGASPIQTRGNAKQR